MSDSMGTVTRQSPLSKINSIKISCVVTEQMVEAATQVLSDYGLRDPRSSAERLVVREALEAALGHCPKRHTTDAETQKRKEKE